MIISRCIVSFTSEVVVQQCLWERDPSCRRKGCKLQSRGLGHKWSNKCSAQSIFLPQTDEIHDFDLVLLHQIPPETVVLSRLDIIVSLCGFEVIILKFSGLLSNLFWRECEPSNSFGDQITAMNWLPIPFLYQRLLLVFQPKSVWVVLWKMALSDGISTCSIFPGGRSSSRGLECLLIIFLEHTVMSGECCQLKFFHKHVTAHGSYFRMLSQNLFQALPTLGLSCPSWYIPC